MAQLISQVGWQAPWAQSGTTNDVNRRFKEARAKSLNDEGHLRSETVNGKNYWIISGEVVGSGSVKSPIYINRATGKAYSSQSDGSLLDLQTTIPEATELRSYPNKNR